MLNQKLSEIKGIGEKRAQLLQKLDLYTVRDMLFFMPRDYEDFSNITPCAALESATTACVMVRFSAEARVFYPRKGFSVVNAQAYDETGAVRVVWYNQPYRKKQVVPGQSVLLYGKVAQQGNRKVFENPDIESIDNLGEDAPNARGILPVYPLTAGIGQKTMRSVVQVCLKNCAGHLQETLPENLRRTYDLCEINYAIQQVHYPKDMDALAIARRRLAMEELFFFLLAIAWLKRKREQEKGIAYLTAGSVEQFLALLPFEATEAQKGAIADIEKDMAKSMPMNRLIQGDVGSGKTVLAFYAMKVAADNDYQSVLLAPTEILARQHLDTARKIFGDMMGIELLIGGMKKSERDAVLERIANGQSQMVIATHAVLQDDICFSRLGLIVTDEQHRFGVKQRAALNRDAEADVLIMSATPIPRTLTLILYGDLDLSLLKGLPPGRKPVSTHYVPLLKREGLYEYVRKESKKGNQTYIVCPLVEQSELLSAKSAEELYKELIKGALADVQVALLHGRMKSAEKKQVIDDFRAGTIRVLISTTVIEVGVDVPQATIMVIEDADRFGLAQLHQLRGRVGRSSRQSYCFLLSSSSSEDAIKRIQIMCQSNDGFVIAQKDLELRGPGEFLGTRQSGTGNFKLARLASDMNVLKDAQNMVETVMKDEDYAAERPMIFEHMHQIYNERLQRIALN